MSIFIYQGDILRIAAVRLIHRVFGLFQPWHDIGDFDRIEHGGCKRDDYFSVRLVRKVPDRIFEAALSRLYSPVSTMLMLIKQAGANSIPMGFFGYFILISRHFLPRRRFAGSFKAPWFMSSPEITTRTCDRMKQNIKVLIPRSMTAIIHSFVSPSPNKKGPIRNKSRNTSTTSSGPDDTSNVPAAPRMIPG